LTHFKIPRKERKKRVKKEMTKLCLQCKEGFIAHKKKQKYCSRKCSDVASIGRSPSRETREKQSRIMKEKIKNGTHKGWSTRNRLSYPEKFFKGVLKNNNLLEKCSINHPVKKRALGLDCDMNYFLDFYFEEKNLDLEIDGRQHERRKEHDDLRDKLLRENGYEVYRIKWNQVNNDRGKEEMKKKIDDFLRFYEEL